jgi:hypothetical protein
VQWKRWLEKWEMTDLKINLKYLEMEFRPQKADREAAWDLYVELLTRVATQHLEPNHGDEEAALSSIHDLFQLTRNTLKEHGRKCREFTKLAVVVLNQVIRPFTAKWHKLSRERALDHEGRRLEFREELRQLQGRLRTYAKMLADLAEVEDLTQLEQE